MYKSPCLFRGVFFAVGLASLSLFSLSSPSDAQTQLADSAAEFSGVQGQDDWNHGYRNLDGRWRGRLCGREFHSLPGGEGAGAWDGVAQFWTGSNWDFNTASAQPWTFLGATNSHPNGTNQPVHHWTIRRWNATAADLTGPTFVQVDWFIQKANTNGTGVSAVLFHNDTQLGKTTLPGTTPPGSRGPSTLRSISEIPLTSPTPRRDPAETRPTDQTPPT